VKPLILLSLLSMSPILAADVQMTSEERTEVIKWLEQSRAEFLAAIDGVSDQQWKWKPAPDRWSVGEVAEHIVLAEAGLFGMVNKALATPADADWETKTKSKTQTLVAVLAPRLGKAQAPEVLVPKGGLTPAQAKERFERQRAEIVKFATDTKAPLKEHLSDNPFFGPLNAYQWLIYVPLHTMRHDKQIAEVKATAGYPK
jgi:hypothetical protein